MEFVVDTIATTEPAAAARPKRSLKHGDSFAVLDGHGDIGVSADGSDGFFHCDIRFLSRLELRFNQIAPLLLGSNVTDDNSILTADLTNPDIFVDNQRVLRKDTLHIVRTTFVSSGNIYQRLGLQNHGEARSISSYRSFLLAILPTFSRCVASSAQNAAPTRSM